MSETSRLKIINSADRGHRREFMDVLTIELAANGIQSTISSEPSFTDPDPVLFAMIEEYPRAFFLSALLRSILRRRTTGLLFRPRQCVAPRTIRHALKHLALRALTSLPGTEVLTILPHALDARFTRISTGWIFDPQLWDLDPLGRSTLNPLPRLCEDLKEKAAGRRVVMALGAQDHDKGFATLATLTASTSFLGDRAVVVAAGAVSQECRGAAESFQRAGGILVDRYIDDPELIGLYQIADFIWCCYLPSYDQSSGVFGRAFQLGVPAIVRAGSYLEKLAELLGHPTLPVDPDDPERAALAISTHAPASRESKSSISTIRRQSVERLLSALNTR